MKSDELLVLGLAGVAVYLIWKTQGAKAAAGVSPSKPLADTFVDEIFNWRGLPYDNGWRYFENGVAIDPQGNYYQNGKLVWSPGSGATGAW